MLDQVLNDGLRKLAGALGLASVGTVPGTFSSLAGNHVLNLQILGVFRCHTLCFFCSTPSSLKDSGKQRPLSQTLP